MPQPGTARYKDTIVGFLTKTMENQVCGRTQASKFQQVSEELQQEREDRSRIDPAAMGVRVMAIIGDGHGPLTCGTNNP